MKKIFPFLLLISLISINAFAAGKGKDDLPAITLIPDYLLRVHSECNIRLAVTNFGVIGSFDGMIPDMEDPHGIAPGAEFPAGSGIENLFLGAIWVGAEIDTIDIFGNPILDTLVTVGFDGWWSIEEFIPPEGVTSLWEEQLVGDEDIFAVFCDTSSGANIIIPDPFDNRPHLPLGFKVTSQSTCWNSPGFDNFIIINYYLENIGNRILHNAYFGIYYDGDVAHESENPYGSEQGAQDDVCGSVEYNGNMIAWLADNNGQPDSNWNFNANSATGALGIVLLGSSIQNLNANFNWWMPNINSSLDWGPQLQSNFDRWGVFPGGGRGTPGGDKAKYQVMSNGERDYDQPFCALDHTDEGWISNVSNVNDMANGFETRYLLSFGPFQILPNEIETLTVAMIGGLNLHIDPYNYSDHLRDHVTDSLSIVEYYSGLNFPTLFEQADTALALYVREFSGVSLGPPRNLRMTFWENDRIGLAWSPKTSPRLGSYRVYRGTSSGEYDPEPITPTGLFDTTFVDTNVLDNTFYYYVISTITNEGIEGRRSAEISVNSGRPHRPENLSAIAGSQEIELDWSPVNEHDLRGYLIYKKWPNQDFELIDTAYTDHYIDYQVANGYRWHYTIAAFDSLGAVSDFSDTVSAIPMYFDSGILIVNANSQGEQNPDFDSMTAFYGRAAAGYNATVADHAPQHLSEWSLYTTVVFCRELISDFNSSSDSLLRRIFGDYIESGGNLIFACARYWTNVNFWGLRNFSEGSLEYDMLNLAGVYYPTWRDTSFAGGTSTSPLFNDFIIDTARAARIIYPPMPHDGHLMGIGSLIPRDTAEVVFRFGSFPDDSSELSGLPIGIIHQAPESEIAVLDFPLYYVTEPSSIEILHAIFEEFGEHRVEIEERGGVLPKEITLYQNYPNPFNASTTISYGLAEGGHVTIAVYNIIGQMIALLYDDFQESGEHKIVWAADGYPSGVYFAKIFADDNSKIIKMILLK